MKQVRPEPEYFRVGFYGKGFPSSVRVRPLTKNPFEEWVCTFALGVKVSVLRTAMLVLAIFFFDVLLMGCVWFNQSKSHNCGARGSHANIRRREIWLLSYQLHLQDVLGYQRVAMGAVEMLPRVQLLSQHYLLRTPTSWHDFTVL